MPLQFWHYLKDILTNGYEVFLVLMFNSKLFIELFGNSSLQAILPGILFIFLFFQSGVFYRCNRFALIPILFCLLLLIVYLDSRAVWIGVGMSICIVKSVQNRWNTLHKWLAFIVTLIAVVILFSYYKNDSSLGRILIYKIDFLLIKNHCLKGINENFSVEFNHEQSKYFLSDLSQINSSEAMLAGNGFMPFNEWVSILIKYGIFAFFLSLIATGFLINLCFEHLFNRSANSTIVAVILFLLIVSLVSYPFHYSLYKAIFLCCVVYILQQSITFLLDSTKATIILIVVLCWSICLDENKRQHETRQIEKVNDDFKLGYVNQSLNKALELATTYERNGNLYYLLSKIYYQKNSINLSLYYLDKAHKFFCSDELHLFRGDCFMATSRYSEAKTEYLTAVTIMPCRLKNRIALIKSYLSLKDNAKAYRWAVLTDNMKIKIPSPKAVIYEKEISELVDSLRK